MLTAGMYLWGIFLCLGALIELVDGVLLAAIFAVIGGAISLPFIRNYITSKTDMKRISGTVAFAISFVLLIAMAIVSPPVSDEVIVHDSTVSEPLVVASTPVSTPTPVPTPMAEISSDLLIGEMTSLQGADIAITDMIISDHYYWSADSGNHHIVQPEHGKIFVIITCNIKRTGSGSRNYYSQNFWLLDEDSYRYDKKYYYGDNELKRSQELHTGATNSRCAII